MQHTAFHTEPTGFNLQSVRHYQTPNCMVCDVFDFLSEERNPAKVVGSSGIFGRVLRSRMQRSTLVTCRHMCVQRPSEALITHSLNISRKITRLLCSLKNEERSTYTKENIAGRNMRTYVTAFRANIMCSDGLNSLRGQVRNPTRIATFGLLGIVLCLFL